MADMCEINGGNEEIYAFRFGTSKKIVQLTQKQLDDIPYLANLINHRNFFSSIQNKNGEYVLSARIHYNWFMPIFQWITTGHPSVLFTKLSEQAYIFRMLQLYDYLCINPIAVPLLKGEHLVRSYSKEIVKKNFRLEYIRAKNLLEVRDTAVQFIITLNKNEYDLNDFDTQCRIFSLIMIILSNPNVFSFRLCYHTLILMNKICFSLFSYSQQRQLQQMELSIQSMKSHSSDYGFDDEEPLPRNFQNAFAWKDVYVSIEENEDTHHRSTWDKDLTYVVEFPRISIDWSRLYDSMHRLEFDSDWWIYSVPFITPVRLYLQMSIIKNIRRNSMRCDEYHRWLNLYSSIEEHFQSDKLSLRQLGQLCVSNMDDEDLSIYQTKRIFKQIEARSARSGHFNTLPKRPKIDKFKHRCGPKAQKYR